MMDSPKTQKFLALHIIEKDENGIYGMQTGVRYADTVLVRKLQRNKPLW
jgi:hypothetical protein